MSVRFSMQRYWGNWCQCDFPCSAIGVRNWCQKLVSGCQKLVSVRSSMQRYWCQHYWCQFGFRGGTDREKRAIFDHLERAITGVLFPVSFPQGRARFVLFFVLFLPRAPRVGRIRPRDCSRVPRLVWRGVRVLAASFPPRRCLSSVVRALCYITCSQSCVARTWSWALGHSTREAQRPSESVASRHEAGPFV